MSTPFPPPPPTAQAAAPRRLWPWVLGCFSLLLLAGVLLVAGVWFGIRALGNMGQQMVAAVPGVQEQFGEITDVGIDWPAISAAAAAGQQAIVLDLSGATGTGALKIVLDPASGQFRSAQLTLPTGEVREFDATMLARLQALQEGQVLPLLPMILPPPAEPAEPASTESPPAG